ncbi:methyltransferase [Streptomyces sp. NRRL S-455]|uniref:methyltransferase n=1 Tax=Streptomyces sp. NRRL S-455 TaxID=1463908 RepID=UPI0004C121DC|nr:methyltransferase [Streptomyces sp. NRRL S-455]
MRVSVDVLAVLDRAETDGNALRLTGQLDRKLYLDTDKVLKAAGGKWNRSKRAHLFDGDAADAIEPVILTGEVVSAKQQFGYFPTPAPVVQQVIDLARIEPGMRVLEPSAGRGALALAAVRAGAVVDCVEIQPEHAEALRDEHHPDITVTVGDFLTTDPQGAYDRVVMNPPFARQADITHILHAYEHLRPGGRLVSVMSAGVAFRETALTRRFWALLKDVDGWTVTLPDNAFKESGTGVRTVIAVVPRPY